MIARVKFFGGGVSDMNWHNLDVSTRAPNGTRLTVDCLSCLFTEKMEGQVHGVCGVESNYGIQLDINKMHQPTETKNLAPKNMNFVQKIDFRTMPSFFLYRKRTRCKTFAQLNR